MYSDEESDFDRDDRNRKDKPKKDNQPVDLETILRAQLTREDLAEYKHRTFFETMVKGESAVWAKSLLPILTVLTTGAYVRCIFGQDERKQPKYRLFQVVGECDGIGSVALPLAFDKEGHFQE